MDTNLNQTIAKVENSVENNESVNNKKINKVNSKKATAQSKANKIITLDSVLKSLDTSLLKTSLGTKNTEIYKEIFFVGMTDKEKKSARRKLRSITFNLFDSIANEKDKEKLKKLIAEFKKFYKEVYKVNDYSFSSVASENTKDSKKDVIKKALLIISKN